MLTASRPRQLHRSRGSRPRACRRGCACSRSACLSYGAALPPPCAMGARGGCAPLPLSAPSRTAAGAGSTAPLAARCPMAAQTPPTGKRGTAAASGRAAFPRRALRALRRLSLGFFAPLRRLRAAPGAAALAARGRWLPRALSLRGPRLRGASLVLRLRRCAAPTLRPRLGGRAAPVRCGGAPRSSALGACRRSVPAHLLASRCALACVVLVCLRNWGLRRALPAAPFSRSARGRAGRSCAVRCAALLCLPCRRLFRSCCSRRGAPVSVAARRCRAFGRSPRPPLFRLVPRRRGLLASVRPLVPAVPRGASPSPPPVPLPLRGRGKRLACGLAAAGRGLFCAARCAAPHC